MTYLHDTIGWIHGDIKPDNMLIRHMPKRVDGKTFVLKLADFDTAYPKTRWSNLTRGTVPFKAPQPVDENEWRRLDQAGHSDMWSVMCVEYAIDYAKLLAPMGASRSITTEELKTLFKEHPYATKIKTWIDDARYIGERNTYISQV